jgi:uncharacterized membrane protein
MATMPQETLYHRSLGWHAPAMRRASIVVAIGLIAALVLMRFVSWELAVAGGWDAAASVFLMAVWPIIVRADGPRAERIATREDQTRGSATALLAGASVASLLGAGVALSVAGRTSGAQRAGLIVFAVLTVVLSWTVVNTVYTLRYADLHFGSADEGIAFGDVDGPTRPSYHDFAYVAFTIGMTYQVSDTTLRDPRIRRTVLAHALLSYLFGVVIVGGSVSLITGLVR